MHFELWQPLKYDPFPAYNVYAPFCELTCEIPIKDGCVLKFKEVIHVTSNFQIS